MDWKPKTEISYRRFPSHPGFELDTANILLRSRVGRYVVQIREHVDEKLATAHSGRYSFYELSRRAGCDQSVNETICGHAETTGSRSAGNDCSMPDDVLKREIHMVWDLVDEGIL